MDALAAEVLSQLEAGLCERPATESIVLAYSGGLDSSALLHLLLQSREHAAGQAFWQQRSLRAVHINHGLQDASDAWAQHCQRQCEAWSVPCEIERVLVEDRGQGIEAAAREARYQAFSKALADGGVLLTAHHRDDQAETILQRLMRASGLRGLAAMSAVRALGDAALLFRPLLSVSRQALESYAEAHGLSWIEDPSNASERFDRNVMRHQVLPLLEQRWPGAAGRLADSARHLRSDLGLLDQLLSERLQQVLQAGDARVLSLSALRECSSDLRQGLLRHWLAQVQCFPTERSMQELEQLLVQNRNDGQALWQSGELELRLWRDGLYRITSPVDEQDMPASQPWQGEAAIAWGNGLLSCEWQVVPQGQPRLKAGLEDLRWRLRGGGERCRLPGRNHHHSLKQILQESDIPPWDRSQLPVLVQGETVVAVPGLFIADGFLAADSEPGWALHWHRY